jgi:hypothetical protein
LTLGNLPPGKKARIDIQMMKALTIESGAYEFIIPVSFMPQYRSHELEPNQPIKYDSDVKDIVSEYSF